MLVRGVEMVAETPCLFKEAARVPLVGSKQQDPLVGAASEKAQKCGCLTTHRVGSVELGISERMYSPEKERKNKLL